MDVGGVVSLGGSRTPHLHLKKKAWEASLRHPIVGPGGIIGMTSIQIEEGEEEWVGLMALHNLALAVPPPAALADISICPVCIGQIFKSWFSLF